jgi:hypothetical protein
MLAKLRKPLRLPISRPYYFDAARLTREMER